MYKFLNILFGGTSSWAILTGLQIQYALIAITGATVIGIMPAFLGAPFEYCYWIPFFMWTFSAYRLIGIQRYVTFAFVGEVVDAFQAIGPETNQTIWDSQVASFYRKFAIGISLAQMMIFIYAPLFCNYVDNGRAWIIITTMVFIAMVLFSPKVALKAVYAISVPTIILLVILLISDIAFNFSPDSAIGKITGALGKKRNAYALKIDAGADRDTVSSRQFVQAQKIWILAKGKTVYERDNDEFNPKSDLQYTEDQRVISLNESTEKNGVIYEKCSLPDPDTGQPGAIIGWIFSGDLEEIGPGLENNFSNLVTKVQMYQSGYPTDLGKYLPVGEYYIEPADTETAKTVIRFLITPGRWEDRGLEGGKFFSVREGEKASSVLSSYSSIKIYRR